MAKVKLIKKGVIQFDPSTRLTWYAEGDVIDTPLTAFVCDRLGKFFEIVELDMPSKPEAKPEVKQEIKPDIKPEPKVERFRMDETDVEITEEDIWVDTKKAKSRKSKTTKRKKK